MIIVLLVFLLLYGLRIYLVTTLGLPDYDAVNNFLIVRQMTESGDFSQLFHHASPLFFLLNIPFYYLFGTANSLIYLNAAVNLFGIAILCSIFYRIDFKIPFFDHNSLLYSLLLLFAGTSSFIVYSARTVAIESWSLLFFAFWLKRYPYQKDKKQLLMSGLFFALLLLINYKALLILPIVFSYELIENRFFTTTRRYDFRVFLALCLGGFVALCVGSLLGMLAGMSWLTYAKYFYVVAVIKDVNPLRDVPSFNSDYFFYFKYMATYETALLVGMLIVAFRLPKITHTFLVTPYFRHCLWIALCFLIGMSVLQKAPRGLLFFYPLAAALIFKSLDVLTDKKIVLYLLIGFAVADNVQIINKNIYRFSNSNYNLVATYLATNKITQLTTTVGFNIAQYNHLNVKPCFTAAQIKDYALKGYHYCLADDFRYVANAPDFTFDADTIGRWREESLFSPYLYLEHCEFSGISYEEALFLRKQVSKHESNLFLLKIRTP
jgi:4-amino-4-deoxy-L-arabinose transferase-like glycosyltransferase